MDYSAQLRDLAKALGRSLSHHDIKVGWTGKIDSAGVVNPDPMDGLTAPYLWVRFEENGEAVRVINMQVSGRMPNMRVKVGRNTQTGLLEVLGLAAEAASDLGDIAPTLNIPDRIADIINEPLDLNRVKLLRAIPGTNAFDVDIAPGFYWHLGEFRAWSGGTINIAASVPGGFNTKRPVLVGIDPATEALVSYDGDVIFMTVPPLDGKMVSEAVIAQTVEDAAMPDVIWVACIPLTVNDGTWVDYFRTTALQFVPGNGSTASSGKVRVSSADTTADFLSSKISAGTGITLTVLNPAGNEELEIAVDESALSISLNDLSDVVIPSPNPLDALYYDGANWVNGDVYVRNTGDSMSGSLAIASTEPSLLTITSMLGALGDANTHGSILATFTLNQNAFNYTSATAAVGARGVAAVSGASGTVTGAAGVVGQVTKTGAGTLTNATSLHASTITKSAGTLTNAIGLYLAAQNAGTNNYGIYQDGAGLNLLTDGLVVNGSTTGTVQQIIRGASGQTASLGEFRVFAGTPVLTIGNLGNLTVAPIATTGTPGAGLTYTGAAHTALTASTEYTDVNIDLARTVQLSTGALTTQRAVRIQAPTYSAVGSSTITTAVTLDVSGAPAPGTNVTITNAIAVRVGGRTQINGTVDIVPPVATTGHLKSFLLTAPAHTAVSASEYIDVDFALNRNVQFTTGSTIGTNRAFVVRAPTYTATSATQTITTAYTFEITGPPVASTNVSITNARAFHVNGVSTFDGQVQINNLLVMGDGQNISVGSTTGTRFGTSSTQKMGWWDAAAVVRDNGWAVTNPSALRTIDATTATLDDCRRMLGTIVTVMKTYGLFGG